MQIVLTSKYFTKYKKNSFIMFQTCNFITQCARNVLFHVLRNNIFPSPFCVAAKTKWIDSREEMGKSALDFFWTMSIR